MFCPVCGREYRQGVDTCGDCGNALVPELPLQQGEGFTGYEAKQSRTFPVEFSGSAREYFRIWIVNLCLTLLTAGIFSAWAKVRKKRYYYSHTTLMGLLFNI